MKLSGQVKPISYLTAHTAEVIRKLGEDRQPIVITLHGEAKAVLQDLTRYAETQETLALLKILALTNMQVQDGKVDSVGHAFERIRNRHARNRTSTCRTSSSEDPRADGASLGARVHRVARAMTEFHHRRHAFLQECDTLACLWL